MTWFNIKNSAEGESKKAVINIFDEIGYDWWDDSGVTAKGFIDAVTALGELDEIHINMSTPGGAVFDGLPILNFLKAHKAKVVFHNFGMIASIGSVIAMAGELHMPSNTILMIHDPSSYAAGNADAMRKVADTLDTVKEGLIRAYAAKTGLPDEEISALMTAETYMTAAQAVELGFADSVIEDIDIQNNHDMTKIRAAAERKAQVVVVAQKDTQILTLTEQLAEVTNQFEALKNPTPPEKAEASSIITACETAKFKNLSVSFIERGLTTDQVTAQLERAGQIQNVCTAAGLGDSVMAIVNEADPIEMIRVAITETQASLDQDLNNQFTPGSGGQSRAINSADIYSKRNTR